MLKKDDIIELIGKDNLNDAFKKVLNHFSSAMKNDLYEEEYETTQLLKGRLKNIKKQQFRGVISNEDFNTEKNKIRDSLLDFVNDLPDAFWNQEFSIEEVGVKKIKKRKVGRSKLSANTFYLIILTVLSLSFMLGYYFFFKSPKYSNILKTDAWQKSIDPNDSAKLNESKLEIKSKECTIAKFIQNIKLQPKTNYKISYSIITEDVLKACKNVDDNHNEWGASICIRDDQTKLAERKSYFNSKSLKNKELIFNSKDATKAKLSLQLGGDGGLTTGYVRFKDVIMLPIE